MLGLAAAPLAIVWRRSAAEGSIQASIEGSIDAPIAEGPAPEPSAGACEEPEEPAHVTPVRLGFVGDLGLAWRVGEDVERGARGDRGVPAGYPFHAVRERLAAVDLAIGNLECVASPRGFPSPGGTRLRAPVAVIDTLAAAGFDVVGIANNHVMDFGREAFLDMRARITAAGLTPIGDGTLSADPEPVIVREVRGVAIGFLAFSDVLVDKARADVARASREVDVLVVVNHWGREDWSDALGVQRELAHALIDEGADVVVGAHAHVLQPEEWYREKLIYYGLGNFVFDGMGHSEARRVGAFLEVDVLPKRVVGRRVYRARLDDRGAPSWVDERPWTPPRVPQTPLPPRGEGEGE